MFESDKARFSKKKLHWPKFWPNGLYLGLYLGQIWGFGQLSRVYIVSFFQFWILWWQAWYLAGSGGHVAQKNWPFRANLGPKRGLWQLFILICHIVISGNDIWIEMTWSDWILISSLPSGSTSSLLVFALNPACIQQYSFI